MSLLLHDNFAAEAAVIGAAELARMKLLSARRRIAVAGQAYARRVAEEERRKQEEFHARVEAYRRKEAFRVSWENMIAEAIKEQTRRRLAEAEHRRRERARLKAIYARECKLARIHLRIAAIRHAISILHEVSIKHGVSIEIMKGDSRKRPFARARQEYFYRAFHEAKLSLPRIGALCGGKDHSTVWHGVAKWQALLDAGLA